MEAMRRGGVDFVLTAHEGSAGFAADVAGRMGGDEFAVLLLEADKHAADRFLRRFRAALPAEISFSSGAAHYPSEAGDADGLLRLADGRQYEVKRSR